MDGNDSIFAAYDQATGYKPPKAPSAPQGLPPGVTIQLAPGTPQAVADATRAAAIADGANVTGDDKTPSRPSGVDSIFADYDHPKPAPAPKPSAFSDFLSNVGGAIVQAVKDDASSVGRGVASGAATGLGGVENLIGGVPATIGAAVGHPEWGDRFFQAGDVLRNAGQNVLDQNATGVPAMLQGAASGLSQFAVGGPEVAAGSAAVNAAAQGAQQGEPLTQQAKRAALEGVLTEAGGRIPITGKSAGKNLAAGLATGLAFPFAGHAGERYLVGDKNVSALPSASELVSSGIMGTGMGMLGALGHATSPAEAVTAAHGLTPDELAAVQRDHAAFKAENAPVARLPAPVVNVDTQGVAATAAQAAAERARLNDLGLTPDVQRAQALNQQRGQANVEPNPNPVPGAGAGEQRGIGQGAGVEAARVPQPEAADTAPDGTAHGAPAGSHAATGEVAAQQAAAQASRAIDPNAKPPVVPRRVVVAPTPLGAGLSTDGTTMYVDPHIPPVLPVDRPDGSVAHVVLYDPNDPTVGGLVVHEGNEFPQMDQRGKEYADAHNENANHAEDAYYQKKYGVSREAVDKALKPYIDAARERSAGDAAIPKDLDRTPYVDGGDEGLLGKPSAQPGRGKPQADPALAQHYFDDIGNEIGWDQVGGRIIRDGSEGADGIGPDPGRAAGNVTGRTKWVGKPRVDNEGESDFWRSRPDKRLTEQEARGALAKARRGEPLRPIEQRFVDYAKRQANDYAQEHAEAMQRFADEQKEANDIERAQAMDDLRRENARFANADHGEALTVAQWAERAIDSGMTAEEVAQSAGRGTTGEKIARLSQAIRERGAGNATERQPIQLDREGGRGPEGEGQAAAVPEGARPAGQARSGQLFAEPTSRERLRAAAEARDAERNGLTREGRKDIHAGPGTLFEGDAPEQFGIQDHAEPLTAADRAEQERLVAARPSRRTPERPVETGELTPDDRAEMDGLHGVHEVAEDDLSPEDRELVRQVRGRAEAAKADTAASDQLHRESVERGEREAGELGLRGAVVEALGPERASKLHFVHDQDGLPEDIRKRGKTIKQGNVRYGLHTPEGDSYIFTKHANTPERAVWTALHEVGGHGGMAELVAAHPDVKVGSLTAKQAHDLARNRVLQNPTVHKLAEVIARQRGSDDLPRMGEEAMAELQAAMRSGDWGELKRKYGVDVPPSVREGVNGALAGFVRRIKAILNAIHAKLTGKQNAFSDADVHDMLNDMWEASKGEGARGESLASEEPDERDLIAQHNTSAERLAHADRMGGFAVPSVAVTRSAHPLDDYGDITLLGSKHTVDPKAGAKVFGSDVYSPRYPEVKFKADRNVALKVAKIIGKRAGESLEVEPTGSAEDLTHQPSFKRYAEEQIGKDYTYHQALSLAEKVLREAGAKEVLFKGYTPSGYRRYIPHTLENVVKELKRNIRGGENFMYGPGSVRAKFTPQFRSIEAIRAAKGKLQSKADFDALKDEISNDFFKVGQAFAPSHDYGNRFEFHDILASTMQDAAKMGIDRALRENQFHDVTPEARAEFAQYLTHLKNLPTHYFEAVLPRAVGIGEFKHAVIPHDTPQATRDLLAAHGVHTTEYDKNVPGDRQRAIREAAQADDLTFSEEPAQATTGVKNAQTKAEREARGLDELHAEGKRSFGRVWDSADARLRADPQAGQSLAQSIIEKPRALSAEETALLTQDRARISVQRHQAADEINAAVKAGDEAGEGIARAKLMLANQQMEVNDKAARQSGYEQGLGLAIRKAMAKLDYSREGMESRLSAAKGKPLDEKDIKRVADIHQKLQDVETQLAGREQAQRGKQQETQGELFAKLKEVTDQWRKGRNANTRQDKIRQGQLAKQILDLKRRIEEGDYSKVKRTPIQYNEDTNRLLAQRNFLRRQFDRLAQQSEYQHQHGKVYRAVSTLIALHRAILLSSLRTAFVKLPMAALYRIVFHPAEHMAQGALSHVPGIRQIADKASIEGHFSAGAELRALRATFSKQDARDMLEKLLHGEDTYDLLYSDSHVDALHPWLSMIGRIHAALHTPPQVQAWTYAMEMQAKSAARQLAKEGKTPEEVASFLGDYRTQAQFAARAYVARVDAAFMGKNWVLDLYNGMLGQLHGRSVSDKEGAALAGAAHAALKYSLPIVRFPSNYVGEVTSYAAGAMKAAAELLTRRGVKNLTPDQADYIMRNLGKQTIGSLFMALGYYGYKHIGSFYQDNDNKRKNIPESDTFYGLPRYVVDSPLGEAMTIGATMHRMDEGIPHKSGYGVLKGTGGVGNALKATTLGVLKDVPFFEQFSQIGANMSAPLNLPVTAGKFVTDFVPPDVKRLASSMDDHTPRKPKTFTQSVEMAVPGLRSKVPEKSQQNPWGSL